MELDGAPTELWKNRAYSPAVMDTCMSLSGRAQDRPTTRRSRLQYLSTALVQAAGDTARADQHETRDLAELEAGRGQHSLDPNGLGAGSEQTAPTSGSCRVQSKVVRQEGGATASPNH